MKKGLLIVLITLSLAELFAQGAKHYPLLEHFTNSRCSVCANKNPGFHSILESYKDQVHHVSFHPSFPYSNCVFHQANPSGNSARAEVYSDLWGTPTVYLNGDKTSGTNLISEVALQDAIAANSPISMRVTETKNGQQINTSVEINALTQAVGNDYRLYVMLVEKEIQENTPNGESVHYNVFRSFLTPKTGTTVDLIQSGQSKTYTFSGVLESEWQEDEIYVLAFVQHENSLDVLNSAASIDVVSSTRSTHRPSYSLQVYPNPVTTKLYVEAPQASQLTLYNVIGKPMLRYSLPAHKTTAELPIHYLPQGIYLLQCNDGTRSFTKRVLIRKP